jgi:hypothetical protein
MTKKGEPLHGNFDLKSDCVVVDELMAFAGPAASTPTTQTGVIIVPADLAVGFHADIKKILYSGLEIDSFKGSVSMDSGAVHVRVGLSPFGIIGIPVTVIGTEDKPIVKAAEARRAMYWKKQRTRKRKINNTSRSPGHRRSASSKQPDQPVPLWHK